MNACQVTEPDPFKGHTRSPSMVEFCCTRSYDCTCFGRNWVKFVLHERVCAVEGASCSAYLTFAVFHLLSKMSDWSTETNVSGITFGTNQVVTEQFLNISNLVRGRPHSMTTFLERFIFLRTSICHLHE